MISIDGLWPKLGNSAFQLATAITLADENADTVAFPKWKYANYFQGCFLPEYSPVSSVYKEPSFDYHRIPYSRNIAISGYFQSYRYFWSNRKKIQKMFSLREQYKHPTIKSEWTENGQDWESCFVHVRLKDYLDYPNHHPIVSLEEYYLPMMLWLELAHPDKRIKFYIFSDDKPTVTEMFLPHIWEQSKYTGYHIEIVQDCDIMAYSGLCSTKHSIIGNSTFSLFPALLKDDGIKIAPSNERWFGPALSHHNLKDLVPEGWIRI